MYHKQKGDNKPIRRNKRRMTDSKTQKKVARKGDTWQRNKNQRLKRVKMEVNRERKPQSDREEHRNTQFDRSRIEIEIESSEDMEINQAEDFLRGNFEVGQSSKQAKRGRKGVRRRGCG